MDEINDWQREYNIFILLDHINGRCVRMTWVRIIAIVSYNNRFNYQIVDNTNKYQKMPKAVNGDIFDYHWNYSYDQYLIDERTDNPWWKD